MYRIKIKSPSQEGQTLFFTTQNYKINAHTIHFTDVKGIEQVWHINTLINIEEVKQ